MIHFMLDLSALDAIVSADLVEAVVDLANRHEIELLTTSAQEAEMARASKARQGAVASIPRRVVEPGVFVHGIGLLDRDRLRPERPYRSAAASSKHVKDGLIAAAAGMDEVTLVTDDVRLSRRAREQGVWTMTADVLAAYLRAHTAARQADEA